MTLHNYPVFYTCQLSWIMRESHACGPKIVISHIQTNFSRLTDTSECNCLKTFEKSSEDLRNSLIMLEIGWKSFGNRWRALFWSRWKSFYTFGYLQKSSVNLRQSSESVGKFSEIQVLRRRKSYAFYWKEVGRYSVYRATLGFRFEFLIDGIFQNFRKTGQQTLWGISTFPEFL